MKNWDKFLPYLLFAYREVPCESTGYSPFELLYGRSVQGPLVVIKETWLGKHPSKESLVSHVLEIRRRLAMMQKAIQEHMAKTQRTQKCLYDVRSSKRCLEVSDKALVLLPTPGSKLEVCWQGPFKVTKVLKDGLNYELDTGKTYKQHQTYHINLEQDVPQFTTEETWEDVVISYELSEPQKIQVKKLLQEYADVFSGNPNVTNAAIHQIDAGDSAPIHCSPYKVPQRLESEVNKEIDKMLELGTICPSNSPWASLVVFVPKPDGTIRFCVNYRKLNSVTKMDAYPIPSMERMIEKVASAKFKLDERILASSLREDNN